MLALNLTNIHYVGKYYNDLVLVHYFLQFIVTLRTLIKYTSMHIAHLHHLLSEFTSRPERVSHALHVCFHFFVFIATCARTPVESSRQSCTGADEKQTRHER